MLSPFDFHLWDGQFQHLSAVPQMEEAHLNPRLNATGTGSVTVRASDPVNQYLQQRDARFTCWYDGAHLMSGKVRAVSGAFQQNGTLTYSLEDDWRVMANTLAWIVPLAKSYPSGTRSSGTLQPDSLTDDAQATSTVAHAAGTAAGFAGYVWDPATTYAETAVKEAIRVNALQRLGRPLTILPDYGRGGDAYTAGMLPVLKFDTLAEGLAELLAWSKLRLRFYQVPGQSTITVESDVASTYPGTLTVESGVILPESTWSYSLADASRIVVGGAGSDIARDYYPVNDATGLESLMADVLEVFRDASGAPQDWGTSTAPQVAKYYRLAAGVPTAGVTAYLNELRSQGRQALTEQGTKSGLSMKLAETATFRFGGTSGVQLGDTITASANGVVLTDRVTEATLDLTADAGLVVTPQVGERTDDPDQQLANALVALARTQRRITKRK